MTEYLSREDIYLSNSKSKNDLEIQHQISAMYEKIAGNEFLFQHFTAENIALQGA